MDLTKPSGLALRRDDSRWPNTFIFPAELRDAIPDYCPRALLFDRVHGFANPLPVPWMPEFGPRAQTQFLVHETGSLEGKYVITMDLDSVTMRALGQFLVDLADQAEARAC